MVFRFGISSLEDDNGYGGRRKLPFAFTEQGIAMLSAILRSDVAIRVSIRIIDTFVEMRKYMANTSLLYERLNAMEVHQINYQMETDCKGWNWKRRNKKFFEVTICDLRKIQIA